MGRRKQFLLAGPVLRFILQELPRQQTTSVWIQFITRIALSTFSLTGFQIDSNRVVFGFRLPAGFNPRIVTQGFLIGAHNVQYPDNTFSVSTHTNDTIEFTVFLDSNPNYITFLNGLWRVVFDTFPLFVLQFPPTSEITLSTAGLPPFTGTTVTPELIYFLNSPSPIDPALLLGVSLGGINDYELVGGYFHITFESPTRIKLTVLIQRGPPFIIIEPILAAREFIFDTNAYPFLILKF